MNLEKDASPSSPLPRGLNILRMIPSHLKVFDNISPGSSQESDLSGPFSEFELGDAAREKRNSEDAEKMDLYARFSFSQEFKSAMESAKEEAKAAKREPDTEEGARDAEEDEEEEEEEDEIQRELRLKVERMLSEKEVRFGSEEGPEEEECRDKEEDGKGEASPKQKPKEEKKKATKHKEEEEEEKEEEFYDTMSGYWRMLSAYTDFRISPPDYNAYENDKPHWLETKPVPYEVMENSRKKCLEWLNENFEN